MLKILPSIRSKDIVMQDLEKEILIYDLLTNKAVCLNETLSTVYQSCNGKTSFEEIKSKHKLTDDLIFLALDQLQINNLLEEKSTDNFSELSRREVIRKIGLTSMVALPVISSLVAPSAINAASVAACANPGGIASGQQVGPTRWTSRGRTCMYPDPVVDRNCGTSFGSQCCSGNAVQRECIQDRTAAVYNCKCT